jgi:hypothetical protein
MLKCSFFCSFTVTFYLIHYGTRGQQGYLFCLQQAPYHYFIYQHKYQQIYQIMGCFDTGKL